MILDIKIINNQAVLFLDDQKKISWRDNRDLSEKLLVKIDQLLKKNKINLSDISKVNFKGENCGFMAEQVGKITARVLNDVK